MSDPIEAKLTRNLERWHASGQAEAWCAARRGVWTDSDWLTLLGSLWWTEYWPMDPAAMAALAAELSRPWHLQRWQESTQPWQWIDTHGGAWNHDDWLALVETLRQSEFWPIDLDAVGAYLEELSPLWQNLQRWKQSELPARWIEAHQGAWSHGDWLELLETLEHSEFWPLDPTTVGQTLEDLKVRYHNLVRWQLSDHPCRWVEARQGTWSTPEWEALLAALEQSEYGPLDPASVARVIEGHQREWWQLRRWRDAGLARRWVEAHDGQWNHDDWLHLLASLRASGFWPIDPDALGRLLEATRTEWLNLRRWQASGQAGQWVVERGGTWDASDVDALFESLWQTEYWPIDTRGVQQALDDAARKWADDVEPRFLQLPLPVTRRAA